MAELADRLIQCAAWMVAMRWSVRLIGLLNTLVLVRPLTPEDFGVVAMAMIVVAFVNAFNDMRLDLALIRLPHLTAGHYLQPGPSPCCSGRSIAWP